MVETYGLEQQFAHSSRTQFALGLHSGRTQFALRSCGSRTSSHPVRTLFALSSHPVRTRFAHGLRIRHCGVRRAKASSPSAADRLLCHASGERCVSVYTFQRFLIKTKRMYTRSRAYGDYTEVARGRAGPRHGRRARVETPDESFFQCYLLSFATVSTAGEIEDG